MIRLTSRLLHEGSISKAKAFRYQQATKNNPKSPEEKLRLRSAGLPAPSRIGKSKVNKKGKDIERKYELKSMYQMRNKPSEEDTREKQRTSSLKTALTNPTRQNKDRYKLSNMISKVRRYGSEEFGTSKRPFQKL